MNTTASGVNATPSDEGTRTTGSEAGERDPFSATTLLRPTRNTPHPPAGETLSSPRHPEPSEIRTFPCTGLGVAA